jgi:hypothetical protein
MLIQTRLLALGSQSSGLSHPTICSTTAGVSLASIRGDVETTGEALERMLPADASPATNEPHEIRNNLRPSMRPPLVMTSQRIAKRSIRPDASIDVSRKR